MSRENCKATLAKILLKEGCSVSEVVEKTGLSRNTVYFYSSKINRDASMPVEDESLKGIIPLMKDKIQTAMPTVVKTTNRKLQDFPLVVDYETGKRYRDITSLFE